MSLAQEPGFRAKNPYRAKVAGDMPARNPDAAERYQDTLRERFAAANKKQKKELYDLVLHATRVLMHNSRNRQRFNQIERDNFARVTMVYQKLKTEFAQEVL